ncbi:Hypothetical predicted protein [Cloeon dipterum]|uniref:Cytochrome P450 n=1 Tax=Cloeon dipterum TaxID=197152 RepID=A0A8S1BVV4_9INSE|nr:Hypothetical predicted protein [Cloeon dipterum]
MLASCAWGLAARQARAPLWSRARSTVSIALQEITALQDSTTASREAKPFTEVPGPKGLPIIGNSWRFLPVVGHYDIQKLDKIMWQLYRDFGKVVRVGGLLGHPDLLFVFDADLVEQIFRREEHMPHRPSMPSLHNYKHVLRKDFFGDTPGVIGVHGQKWHDFRVQVQQVVLQPAVARQYISPLNDIANDFMDRIDLLRDSNSELPGAFLGELYKWALESIGRVALDSRLGCLGADIRPESEQQRIIDAMKGFFENVSVVELRSPFWRLVATPSWKKYINALDTFRELCMERINAAVERLDGKKEHEGSSLLERVLDRTGDPKIAATMALDLLLVGIDTTSVSLASTLNMLARNPEKQDILYEELKQAMPDPSQPTTESVLNEMPFLRACVKETLRMYPVIIGNGRSLTSDAEIGGYQVPKGTHVIFPHYVLSNIPEYFPRPSEFLPERWLKSSTDKCPVHQGKIHPFASLPFSFGRRTCLGKRFAYFELHILLSKIFRKYKVEYHYGDIHYTIHPTYIPESPLKFKLIEREE